MFKIVDKKVLNPTVTRIDVYAPFVAKKAQAGQFIIFRIDEQGERVPLTIADYDREKGTVTIIYQVVGFSTMQLDRVMDGALDDIINALIDADMALKMQGE